MLPNANQAGDLARQVTQMLSTGLMLYGVSQSTTALVVGIVGMAIPIIWGMISHTKVGTIIAAAYAVKEIDPKAKIVIPNAPEITGAATPSNVVPG